MGWQVERIAGTCGAIVRGVDLRRPQTPEQTAELTALLDEHLVVALPDQFLDLDQLERATDELGGRDMTPYVKPVEGRPYVIRVIKEPHDELNFANAWHTDLSYLPEPPSYTLLHAHDVPAFGGDTVWANQQAAFDTLPAALQDRADRHDGDALGRVRLRHRRLPRLDGRQEFDGDRGVGRGVRHPGASRS